MAARRGSHADNEDREERVTPARERGREVPPGEPAAAARRARFGRLPQRIRPEDMIEAVDPETARDHREPREPRREWGGF